jgi:hypothetical protein
VLYVSEVTAGSPTVTPPVYPNLKQEMGTVLVSDATVGMIQVVARGIAAQLHGASHTDGVDDIQDATAAQKGLATAAQITKLDGIEAAADVTDAANVAAAGAVMASLVDAKGDLIVGTADNTVGRLAVGTNGYALIADSGEAAGMKWGAPVAAVYPTFQFFADQFRNPANADWAVNSLAPVSPDPTNNALPVRLFDDTTEEGVGCEVRIPTGATNIKFTFQTRAATAPGGARQVVFSLYEREIPDDGAVTAWSARYNLTAIDIPTNAYFQTDTQTISLATLGLTAGMTHQFELTRYGAHASDTLTGDLALLFLGVEFS